MQGRLQFAGLVAILAGLPLSHATDAAPPADHPIYRAPQLRPIRVVRDQLVALPCKPDRNHLAWKFEPASDTVSLGDLIEGRLHIKNSDKSCSYQFSPPYHGQFVSTISLWVSRRKATDDGWTDPEEIYQVNKGYYRQIDVQFQGKPIVLAPGEEFEVALPINVLQPVYGLDRLGHWYVGAGFAKPGKYRYYLKYVNLDYVFPFDPPPPNESRHLWKLEDKPVVLGPFDVEVLPGPPAINDKMQKLLGDWNRHLSFYRYPRGDDIPLFHVEGIDTALATEGVDWSKREGLRIALEMARLRYALSPPRREDAPRGAPLEQLKQRVENLIDESLPGASKDAFILTRCFVLDALGQTDTATRLARKLQTPDAEVFIEHARGR